MNTQSNRPEALIGPLRIYYVGDGVAVRQQAFGGSLNRRGHHVESYQSAEHLAGAVVPPDVVIHEALVPGRSQTLGSCAVGSHVPSSTVLVAIINSEDPAHFSFAHHALNGRCHARMVLHWSGFDDQWSETIAQTIEKAASGKSPSVQTSFPLPESFVSNLDSDLGEIMINNERLGRLLLTAAENPTWSTGSELASFMNLAEGTTKNRNAELGKALRSANLVDPGGRWSLQTLARFAAEQREFITAVGRNHLMLDRTNRDTDAGRSMVESGATQVAPQSELAHERLDRDATAASSQALEPFTNATQRLIDDPRQPLSEDDESFIRAELEIIRAQHRVTEGADVHYITRAVGRIVLRLLERRVFGSEAREILVALDAHPPSIVEEIVDGMTEFATVVANQWAASNLATPEEDPIAAAIPIVDAGRVAEGINEKVGQHSALAQRIAKEFARAIPQGAGESVGSRVIGIAGAIAIAVSRAPGADAILLWLIEAAPTLSNLYTYRVTRQ